MNLVIPTISYISLPNWLNYINLTIGRAIRGQFRLAFGEVFNKYLSYKSKTLSEESVLRKLDQVQKDLLKVYL